MSLGEQKPQKNNQDGLPPKRVTESLMKHATHHDYTEGNTTPHHCDRRGARKTKVEGNTHTEKKRTPFDKNKGFHGESVRSNKSSLKKLLDEKFSLHS
jgi:fatty-acid desaturase